jgi:hypothetical protein
MLTPFVIFATFGVWWWLLVAVASVVIVLALENSKGGWATVTAIAAVALMVFAGDLEIHKTIFHHPGKFFGVVAAYFALGGAWGVAKWYLFVTKRREAYEDRKRNWLLAHAVDGGEVPENLKAEWHQTLVEDYEWSHRARVIETDTTGAKTVTFRVIPKVKPFAWEHKGRIVTWMTYWPWSLLWAALDDLVKNVFKRIQQHLNSLMDRIAAYVFRGTEKDYAVPSLTPSVTLPTDESSNVNVVANRR